MTDELITVAEEETVHREAMEWRTNSRIAEVRFPDRIVTLIAVPYDEDAAILSRGRWITESVAPGAFDGVEFRAKRIKVNRDHDELRTVGRAVTLYPSRTEGLVADVKISRTPLGDETLELAADEVLDASVAFAPIGRGGEVYSENRSRRRIVKAFLGHIALTPEPAYDGARVVAVRSMSGAIEETTGELETLIARTPTPNLDRILAERLVRKYSPLQ